MSGVIALFFPVRTSVPHSAPKCPQWSQFQRTGSRLDDHFPDSIALSASSEDYMGIKIFTRVFHQNNVV